MKFKGNVLIVIAFLIGTLFISFWYFVRPEWVTVNCSREASEQTDKMYNQDGLINKPYLEDDKNMQNRHDLYSKKRYQVFIECLKANGGPFR